MVKIFVCFLLIATIVLMKPAAAAQGLWYKGSCLPESNSDGRHITAWCKTIDGQKRLLARIDTNRCFAYSKGKLVCRRNGNYAASCRNIKRQNDFMLATCRGKRLSISTNLCIGNANGRLTC
ncbi:hypothetical protein I4U23_015674 [Adineta vaga]|nr:hypothetical protein I4U23_015674 [Adineta vaga]